MQKIFYQPPNAVSGFSLQQIQMWVTTFRVPPPPNKIVLVKFGASVCFAVYSKWQKKWFLCANGGEEEIAAPSLYWSDNPNLVPDKESEPIMARVKLRQSRRGEQMVLKF